jgi:hypothetical protein
MIDEFDFDNAREADGVTSHVAAATGADTSVYDWVYDRITAGLRVRVNALGQLPFGAMNVKDVMDHLIMINEDRAKADRFSVGALRGARDQIVQAMMMQRRADLRQEISHVPNPVVQQALTDLLTSADDGNALTPAQCAKIVLKFMWQVRRKLFGLPVTDHLMVVFVGRQGAGKSRLVSEMCQPLAEVTTNTNLAAITDERNIDLFKSYIGVIDELDRADRASVESLRAVITQAVLSRRPMRENGFVNVPQNMTFIGTSNKDVGEVIVDETGNRRFAQINLIGNEHANSAAFWQAVCDLDWLALWRSVDETAADPTADIQAEIREEQAATRSPSGIESWVDHLVQHKHSYVTTAGKVATTALYEQFRIWEENYGNGFRTSSTVFTKALARMAKQKMIPFTKARSNKGRFYNTTVVTSTTTDE